MVKTGKMQEVSIRLRWSPWDE